MIIAIKHLAVAGLALGSHHHRIYRRPATQVGTGEPNPIGDGRSAGTDPRLSYPSPIPNEVSPRYQGEQGCDVVRSATNQCFPYH